MATGDQADIASRIRAVLPARWFPDTTPVLDGILAGLGAAWATIYALLAYARLQTRLATATGNFLDMAAADFLSPPFGRLLNESDAAFSARLRATILQPRVTRAAMVEALTTLTGQAPAIFEPANTGDTGGYGGAHARAWSGMAYGIAGGWGSMQLPFQAFVIAEHPSGGGVANVGGYYGGTGWAGGGYGVGAIEYITPSMIEGEVTDDIIYYTVAQTQPAGSIMWTRIGGAGAFAGIGFFAIGESAIA